MKRKLPKGWLQLFVQMCIPVDYSDCIHGKKCKLSVSSLLFSNYLTSLLKLEFHSPVFHHPWNLWTNRVNLQRPPANADCKPRTLLKGLK